MDPIFVALIVAFVIVDTVVLLIVLRAVARRSSGGARQAAEARIAHSGEAPLRAGPANCLGHDRAGAPQVRGLGWLVLTGDALVFALNRPEREIEIPVTSITAVEARRRFTRKGFARGTLGNRMLVVEVQDETAWKIGWETRGAQAWESAVRQASGLPTDEVLDVPSGFDATPPSERGF